MNLLRNKIQLSQTNKTIQRKHPTCIPLYTSSPYLVARRTLSVWTCDCIQSLNCTWTMDLHIFLWKQIFKLRFIKMKVKIIITARSEQANCWFRSRWRLSLSEGQSCSGVTQQSPAKRRQKRSFLLENVHATEMAMVAHKNLAFRIPIQGTIKSGSSLYLD